jgi:hypothetical protein
LIAILVVVGVAMSMDRRPAPAKLPDPNGYDDLVQAGSLVNGDWFHTDLTRPDLARLRPLVEANRAALELARVGLGRECVVPIENSQEGLSRHIGSTRQLIQLSRLFQGEAIVFEVDGRFLDSSKTYREKIALGQAIAQGGMGEDMLLGSVFQIQAIGGLRELCDRLPSEEIPVLLRELESVDKHRVSLRDVDDRWQAWYQGAHNPLIRTMYRWNGVYETGQSSQINMARQGRERAARSLRFLLAELAIHAYHEDKKAWPRSLGDLVPVYLASVPLDPVTGLPIDYPANPSGELTNDLSAIALPDGEISTPSASPSLGDPVGDGPD